MKDGRACVRTRTEAEAIGDERGSRGQGAEAHASQTQGKNEEEGRVKGTAETSASSNCRARNTLGAGSLGDMEEVAACVGCVDLVEVVEVQQRRLP